MPILFVDKFHMFCVLFCFVWRNYSFDALCTLQCCNSMPIRLLLLQNLCGLKKSIGIWAHGHLFDLVLKICAAGRLFTADVRKAPQLPSVFHLGIKLKLKMWLSMHLKAFKTIGHTMGRSIGKHFVNKFGLPC